jgi:uncharacterized protein YecT (DUF1311 family)
MRWLALIVALLAPPAFANEAGDESYAEIVRSCFDAVEGPARAEREACIGKVVAMCGLRGEATGKYDCLAQSWEAWEALAAREYGLLLRRAFELDREVETPELLTLDRLEEAHSAWTAFRNAECAFQARNRRDVGLGLMCLRDMTAARAIDLWQSRQEFP